MFQFFAILFFFMLFVLGIGSAVALHNTIITIFCDKFPNIKYWKAAGVASICGFLCGLIYVTPGGQWMLNLVDHFGGTFLIFALAIIEVISIFWIYGLEQFCFDSEFMLNRKVTIYWRLCWAVITPGFMIIIFIYNMIKLENPRYSGWDYPNSALAAGWVLFVVGIIQVPLWATWVVAHNKSSFPILEKIKAASRPSPLWGPKNDKIRAEWKLYKAEAKEKRNKISTTNNDSIIRQKINILLGKYY